MEEDSNLMKIPVDLNVSKAELYQTIDELCDMIIWMSGGFLRVDISEEEKITGQRVWESLRDTRLKKALELFA